ncbi:helix-turn-helix domain-containing protein, partial [Mycolicibacter minnesotensis]
MTTLVDAAADEHRTFDERLGEAVHQALWRRRIKQTEFAPQVLGITQSALSSKLRGRRPFFAGEISLICAALGIAVDELLPKVEVNPPGDDDGGGASAPSRTRTYDLRI